jgi:hypothetical protein
VLVISPWSDGGGSNAPAASSGTIPQPSLSKLGKLARSRLAPDSRRVDLAVPSFSRPTRISNPLFPIGHLRSALILGRFNGRPLRIETTLLPGRRTVHWSGRRIETLQSQFLAFLDGRIYEVAVDKYAQDDNGAVWYLGEEAFSYDKGLVADTGDTWIAGVDGPPAMIMPGHPKVGDVYRTENAPGHIFEQVTVKRLGQTANGPTGPVKGALVGQELHMEGDVEDKTFAPGYGEFFSGLGQDYEATALALPADAASGRAPRALEELSRDAGHSFEAARSKDWKAASAATAGTRSSWHGYPSGQAPRRIAAEMNSALGGLERAVHARKVHGAGLAALDVAQAGLDLELRYRPPAEVDKARLELWAQRLGVDAAAGSAAAVRGDVTSLGWIRDRIVFAGPDASRIDDLLRYLRAAAEAKQLDAAGTSAARLRTTLAGLKPQT